MKLKGFDRELTLSRRLFGGFRWTAHILQRALSCILVEIDIVVLIQLPRKLSPTLRLLTSAQQRAGLERMQRVHWLVRLASHCGLSCWMSRGQGMLRGVGCATFS